MAILWRLPRVCRFDAPVDVTDARLLRCGRSKKTALFWGAREEDTLIRLLSQVFSNDR
jgi:hypothetical protein